MPPVKKVRKTSARGATRSRRITGNLPSSPVGLGLRARSRAAVRARLIAAAHELFENLGFDSCTTTDIASRAEVSQRTFFRYFPLKEDVVLDWFDFYNAKICDRLRRRPLGETEWQALRRACDHFCHLSPQDTARVQLIRRLSANSTALRSSLLNKQSEWERHIAGVLSERQQRDAETDHQAKFLAGFAMSVLVTAFREVGRGGTTAEEMIDLGFATLKPTIR